MEPQNLQTIAHWSGGKLLRGNPVELVGGISTDSRSVRPGELFLALSGLRFDGHDFAEAALRQGAGGVILARVVPGIDDRWADRSLILVKDTLRALSGLARGYRALFDLAAIAVTGSNGKTTTKNLLGRLLGVEMETLTAPASYNNLIGVSLTVLRMERRHRAAVFELGMNHRGEIRELADVCRPQVGVITNIGPAHIGLLGSIEEIVVAKGELLEGLEGEKMVFFNADDRRVRDMVRSAPGPVIGFGFGPEAQIRASNLHYRPDGVRFDLILPEAKVTIQSPFPGLHNVYNLLAALGVSVHLGIGPEQLREVIRSAKLPPQRMERVVVGGAVIIDDAYNANPASMRAALDGWMMMESSGRRIMVSGDMNELGSFSRAEHRRWGEVLGEMKLDYLIFVGPRSREAARAAAKSGFPGRRVLSVDDSRMAAELLHGILQPGDSVLIKGSRVMAMEEIVEILKESEGIRKPAPQNDLGSSRGKNDEKMTITV